MPSLPPTKVPTLCRHKAKNRAFVRLSGRMIYCGPWGSAEAREKYDHLIREWLANGRALPQETATADVTPDDFTIEALAADYIEFARGHYVKNGEMTDEVACVQAVIRLWANTFPNTAVAAFGPKALKQLRDEMIRLRHTRRTINNNINRVRRIIAWGVEEEKVDGGVLYALKAVRGLRRGRSGANEGSPVRPVSQELVAAVLPHCNRQVRAMIEMQLATGMRPGEVVIMRGCDITDIDKPTWKYTPAYHKTEDHEIVRQIPLGPRAQTLVREFLTTDPDSYLFTPENALADQRAARRAARETPLYPSHEERQGVENPAWEPSQHYDVDAYRRAITRACDKAAPYRPSCSLTR